MSFAALANLESGSESGSNSSSTTPSSSSSPSPVEEEVVIPPRRLACSCVLGQRERLLFALGIEALGLGSAGKGRNVVRKLRKSLVHATENNAATGESGSSWWNMFCASDVDDDLADASDAPPLDTNAAAAAAASAAGDKAAGNEAAASAAGPEAEDGAEVREATEWMESVRHAKFAHDYEAAADAFAALSVEVLGHDLGETIFIRPKICLMNVLKDVFETAKMKQPSAPGASAAVEFFNATAALFAAAPGAAGDAPKWPVALAHAVAAHHAKVMPDAGEFSLVGHPVGKDHPDVGFLFGATINPECPCKRKNDEVYLGDAYVRSNKLREIRAAANKAMKEYGPNWDVPYECLGLIHLVRILHSSLSASDDIFAAFFAPITAAASPATELPGHGGRSMHVDKPEFTAALQAAGVPVDNIASYWGDGADNPAYGLDTTSRRIAEAAVAFRDTVGLDGDALGGAIAAYFRGETRDEFSPSSAKLLAIAALVGNYDKRMIRMRWRTFKNFGTEPGSDAPHAADFRAVRAAFKDMFGAE
ncbi:uncharacterized protein AMSG_02221 [Thecamonas trahens ATCC 50062]|uniref:Uncharacterized protein n=1 Tax=Thecamonas trahens ATCC 50062 TaxID=461836 RepID=A0A0L0DVP6_THETB|nr:hypothetical protein AMSG_02221 [Thecamonas trahens ATCC 50062]KNC56252.1 hypothetical protein AMSG_02221 [Thecamonas trahens ATCC 50062]|eukprot:XP_013760774.1 hypothetical protein AMSG_02221 [Thecamonas trahens ATCC 50062]